MSTHDSTDHDPRDLPTPPRPDQPSAAGTAPPAQPHKPPARAQRGRRRGPTQLLFGAVEDLLADLVEQGGPDDQVVRVERIVRTQAGPSGGTATLGVAVTARRADDVLACWAVAERLALDPGGQPLDRAHARTLTAHHQEAQHLIGALVADAGFAVRLGLCRFPEHCDRFAATCVALDATADPGWPEAPGPQPQHQQWREDVKEEEEHDNVQ